jgi:hypothetical protein
LNPTYANRKGLQAMREVSSMRTFSRLILSPKILWANRFSRTESDRVAGFMILLSHIKKVSMPTNAANRKQNSIIFHGKCVGYIVAIEFDWYWIKDLN